MTSVKLPPCTHKQVIKKKKYTKEHKWEVEDKNTHKECFFIFFFNSASFSSPWGWQSLPSAVGDLHIYENFRAMHRK